MNTAFKLILLCTALLAACGERSASRDPHGHADGKGDDHGHAHGHDAHAEEEAVRGPHGGRLLEQDGFAVELAIFEDGVPPEYRAWITRHGKALAPAAVTLGVDLTRLDGEVNRYAFAPQDDFLRGAGVVAEPHSFTVAVQAEHDGRKYAWRYDSFEGRVSIPEDSARAAGVTTERAGPRAIHESLALYGRIAVRPEAQREVAARFPGTVVSVARAVGDTVRAGEPLARVESSDSLQVYTVSAPIAGTVTARSAQPGELAGSAALFTLTDLDQVWAELSAFARDLPRLAPGQRVRLRGVDGRTQGQGRVQRVAPSASGAAVTVWVSIDPGEARWTPGLFVDAEVLTGGAPVALAVRASAVQAFRDFSVVFAKVGDTYEVRMLDLGRSDGEYVEVLGGLKPDTEYVSANSYLIKADIEKSGASHDH